MQTDEELMIACRSGQTGAFDTLVRRHWTPVEGFLRRLLQDSALAEDVLLECFFKLHRALPTYRPDARFKTFLYRIAYHEAISALRRRHRLDGPSRISFSSDEGLQVPCPLPSSEDALLAHEDRTMLDALIDTLNPLQRAVFLLYYRDEMPTPEIALTLDIPVTSVRAYLCLARKALRARLTLQTQADSIPILSTPKELP